MFSGRITMNPTNTRPSTEDSPYFEIQADVGITKHMGGRRATDNLVRLCQIEAGQTILEIGCGTGRTSCYLAKKYACHVIAIDINPGMVKRAQLRAQKQHLQGLVNFQVADAQLLPFSDNTFDVVIDESVTAFVSDKQAALNEYARVVKSGAFVGLNEVTWIKEPTAELEAYVAFIMANAKFHNSEQWLEYFHHAGLLDNKVHAYPFRAFPQLFDELRQFNPREYIQAWGLMMKQLLKNPDYRRFAGDVLRSPGNIFRFMKSIGYGLYIGRKPD